MNRAMGEKMTTKNLRKFVVAAAMLLGMATASHAFVKLYLPANWDDAPPAPTSQAPACERGSLDTLKGLFTQWGVKDEQVTTFTGDDAADYLAGARALFNADLPDASTFVIVRIEQGGETVYVVFAFDKDGCFLYRVGAKKEQHEQVLDWVKAKRATS